MQESCSDMHSGISRLCLCDDSFGFQCVLEGEVLDEESMKIVKMIENGPTGFRDKPQVLHDDNARCRIALRPLNLVYAGAALMRCKAPLLALSRTTC